MQNLILLLPRLILGLCGALVGGWCAKGAFESGMDFAGPIAAAGFCGIVVGCWFISPVMRTSSWGTAILGGALLIVGTLFVLITSIGTGAKHRSSHVGVARDVIEAYDRASRELPQFEAELATMRAHPKRPGELHPRWLATAGCANATLPESEDYCRNVRRAQADITAARAVLSKGRPLSADPQAASMRRLIDMTPDEFNEWWPILASIVSELFATGLMTMAFAPLRLSQKPQAAVEAPQLTALAEPAWMSSTPLCVRQFPRYERSAPFGRVDGRALRWLAKDADDPNERRRNDNVA